VLPSERDAALASGASHFLEKPYVPGVLTDMIAGSLAAGTATER
jgi:hypothetical protein